MRRFTSRTRRRKWTSISRSLLITGAILAAGWPGDASAQANPFQWAKRVASTVNEEGEFSIGMALDSQGNVYVTGWFDGTNDFGGIILTNRGAGGQDIFVAKYTSAGTNLWARLLAAPRRIGTRAVASAWMPAAMFT